MKCEGNDIGSAKTKVPEILDFAYPEWPSDLDMEQCVVLSLRFAEGEFEHRFGHEAESDEDRLYLWHIFLTDLESIAIGMQTADPETDIDEVAYRYYDSIHARIIAAQAAK